jgi:glycopeptide antibiotics resistance protein
MPYTEIPAFPVLAPLVVVAIGVAMWWLRRHDALTPPRAAVGIVACVYVAGVLDQTLFPYAIITEDRQPWHIWLNLTPFVDVIKDPIGIVLNVALFVPLGVLLPLVARVDSVRRVVLYGFAISLGIELVQFIGDITVSGGRVADVDDLIGNVLGTLIGYGIFRLVTAIPAAHRLAAEATWPQRGESMA